MTTVRTTSTSFITGAGLKKCSPTTLPGRPVATAISVIDSEEVLVARIVSGLQMLSSSPKIARLRSSCSGTASTTRSTSLSAPRSVPKVIRSSSACCVLGAQLAAVDGAAGGALDVRAAARERGLVGLDRDYLHAAAGAHLGDARAHRAEPDDADPLDIPCHVLGP